MKILYYISLQLISLRIYQRSPVYGGPPIRQQNLLPLPHSYDDVNLQPVLGHLKAGNLMKHDYIDRRWLGRMTLAYGPNYGFWCLSLLLMPLDSQAKSMV